MISERFSRDFICSKINQMKISIISDIHAADYNQSGNLILEKFLNHKEVLEADVVVFLGDIFDIMIGNYDEYAQEEKAFFDWIKIHHKKKTIHFHEGNHDFHLEKLFRRMKLNVCYHQSGFVIEDEELKYYLEHGDDIELDNKSYKFYKSLIRSRAVQLLAELKWVPYQLVRAIGTRASLRSRTIDAKYRKNAESQDIKEKFRVSYLSYKMKNLYDIVVCGHGHIKDKFISNSRIYINNGYAPHSHSFIMIENGEATFIDLDQ